MKRLARISCILFVLCLVLTSQIVWGANEYSHENDVELMLLERINEVRSNPWDEAERLGFDIQQMKKDMASELVEAWNVGLPAFSWDQRLAAAALKHVEDMFNNLYYSHISLDGAGPEERVIAEKFVPVFLAESLGAVVFENVISIEEASELIVNSLFYDAFSGGDEGKALLTLKATHIGLAIGGGQLQIEDKTYNVYVMCIDIAQGISVSEGMSLVWGHVYQDLNGNGRYDFGEGIPKANVILFGPLTDGGLINTFGPILKKQYLTQNEGLFSFQVPSGLYGIGLEGGSDMTLQYYLLNSENAIVRSDIIIE